MNNLPSFVKRKILLSKPRPTSNSAEYCAICKHVGFGMIHDENGRTVHGACRDRYLNRK
jgi:hypothetical protein